MKSNVSVIDEQQSEQNTEVIKIDIAGVLRSRMPRYYRYIPRFIVRWLEKTICQKQLNRLLENNAGKEGAEFCRGVLEDLNISYEVKGEELLPPVENRRVVIMSNHPLGGLDGIVMIDYFTRRYGAGVKFVVNDLLMAIKPLKSVFLPVNKHGKQSREALRLTNEAFAGNDPIIVFPAGLVSRLHKNGEIKDLKWQKSFIQRSVEYKRDIIPVYFDGVNSSFFYKFAKFRQRVGLKFNIEMVYLPREVFRNENARFSITVAPMISWQTLSGGKNARKETDLIRRMVYNLKVKIKKHLLTTDNGRKDNRSDSNRTFGSGTYIR